MISTEISIKVKGILNPKEKGGTGNFAIITRHGNNVFDENKIYSTLGVAGDIVPMGSPNIDISDTTAAGESTKYNFAFKTSVFLPDSTYLEYWIPDSGYQISSNPSCFTYPINNKVIKG